MPHEEALRNVQLFSQLSSKDLNRLGRAVVERTYQEGGDDRQEGEQAVAFFIIIQAKSM